MTYRTPPGPEPLITYLGGALLALSPHTGAMLWRTPCRRPERVVVSGRLVFAASSGWRVGEESQVFWLDIETGAAQGSFQPGFHVRTALAHGRCVYFGGPRGLLGLRDDGSLLFHARGKVVSESLLKDETDLIMRDGGGSEVWRIKDVAGGSSGDGSIVIGAAAAQPDLDT